MNKKVSIIIPVYNPGECLQKCIGSLLSQSYKDLEIILVNDKSTDGSDAICKEYARKYNFFKYIEHELNKGQTITRNDGIEAAEGEWMLFLDSDDCLKEDALSLLVSESEKYNADIVLCDYKTIDDHGNEKVYSSNIEEKLYTTRELLKHLFDGIPLPNISCVGSKLYRMSFIRERKPKTSEDIKTNYDLAFALDALSASPSIAYKKMAGYIYYIREGSISHSYRQDMYGRMMKARENFKSILLKNGVFEEKELDYHKSQYSIIRWSLLQEVRFSKGYKHFRETFKEIRSSSLAEDTIKYMLKKDKSMKRKLVLYSLNFGFPLFAYCFLSVYEKK